MSDIIDVTRTNRMHLLARRYWKTATIRAVQLDFPFSVQSKEGADFSGKAGDYLAIADDDSDEQPHRWIISRADFEKTYEAVEKTGDGPMTNPPSVPSLDVEAQPDPPKLESRADLHRTAAQPEKEGLAAGSGASLDVEACVEALKAAEAALSASCHTATYRTTLRALASALPGMGKDSEPTVAEVIAWLQKRPGGSWIATIVDIDIAVKSLRAARTAQPEETSVDERP